MQKLINKFLIAGIIIFFVEVLLCTGLYLLNDYIDILEYSFTVILGISFLVADAIYVVVALEIISFNKSKNDSNAIDTLSYDIENAYSFGKIGLVIVDDDFSVIWTNKYFKEINNNLLEKKITSWVKEIRDVIEGKEEKNKTFVYNGNTYEFDYVADAHLFIFKDITAQATFKESIEENGPCIGLIQVDNYKDLANSYDESSMNDDLMDLQREIAEYAKVHNMMIKKIKADTYLFFCQEKVYKTLIEEDKLSIIEKVKTGPDGRSTKFTISIGIASGIEDYNYLYEQASKALDIALSRGGDQGVADFYGKNMVFLGGTTKSQESKNMVEVRTHASFLSQLITDADNVFIMGHSDADFDAIGSCLGLYSLAKSLNNNSKIVYTANKIEFACRAAFRKLYKNYEIDEMTIAPAKALEMVSEKTLLILTDVHQAKRTISPELCEACLQVVVIDHHRRNEEIDKKLEINYIDSSRSSASEMVVDLINFIPNHPEIEPRVATMLLTGILLDTNNYHINAGSRTFLVSSILKDWNADFEQANSFLKVTLEDYLFRTKALANSFVPVPGVVVAVASDADIVDQATLSRVAIECINSTDVNACFVLGKIGPNTVSISSRSDGTINCSLVCERLGGGGTFSMAAARFDGEQYTIDSVKQQLVEKLEAYADEIKERKNIE